MLLFLQSENSAQSFSDRSFWKPLRVVDVRAFGDMDVRAKMLVVPGFRPPWPNFWAGISARMTPGCRGMSRPKNFLFWADFFVLDLSSGSRKRGLSLRWVAFMTVFGSSGEHPTLLLLVLQNAAQWGNSGGFDGFGGFGGHEGPQSWRLPPLNSTPLFRDPDSLSPGYELGVLSHHLECAMKCPTPPFGLILIVIFLDV